MNTFTICGEGIDFRIEDTYKDKRAERVQIACIRICEGHCGPVELRAKLDQIAADAAVILRAVKNNQVRFIRRADDLTLDETYIKRELTEISKHLSHTAQWIRDTVTPEDEIKLVQESFWTKIGIKKQLSSAEQLYPTIQSISLIAKKMQNRAEGGLLSYISWWD